MSLGTPQFGSLQGMKVVLVGTFIAGPFCADVLAENGAEVMQLENASVKDPVRSYGNGMLFGQDRRNMYSMAIEIPTPEGKKIFTKLVQNTEVLIEANKAGTLDKWGFSDKDLFEINPKLIIAHISGFGQTGDPQFVKRAAFDVIGQAFSGYSSLNGKPGDIPSYAKPSLCDFASGMFGLAGILMAYIRAQKTGIGESIDIAMYESLLRLESFFPVMGFTDGIEPERYEGTDATITGDSYYVSKDGKYVCIFVAGASLQKLLKHIGLGDAPEYKKIPFVLKKDTEMSEKYLKALQDFVAQHTADELETILNNDGVACSRLMSYGDMMANSHYQARQSIIEFYAPSCGRNIKGPAPTPRFANNPQQIWRGGATHGEDNGAVLSDLGYSDEQIAALYENGTIGRLK